MQMGTPWFASEKDPKTGHKKEGFVKSPKSKASPKTSGIVFLAPFKVDPFLAGLEACVDAGMASEDVLLGWQAFADAERDAEVGYCTTCLDLRARIASSMPKNKDKNDMTRYRTLANNVRRLRKDLERHVRAALQDPDDTAHPRIGRWYTGSSIVH